MPLIPYVFVLVLLLLALQAALLSYITTRNPQEALTIWQALAVVASVAPLTPASSALAIFLSKMQSNAASALFLVLEIGLFFVVPYAVFRIFRVIKFGRFAMIWLMLQVIFLAVFLALAIPIRLLIYN